MSKVTSIVYDKRSSSTLLASSISDAYTTIGSIYDRDKEDTINNSDGDYISAISINGKRYKIKAEVVEIFPTVCKKCGSSFELHHGEGRCPYCGTHYTTMYKVVEG